MLIVLTRTDGLVWAVEASMVVRVRQVMLTAGLATQVQTSDGWQEQVCEPLGEVVQRVNEAVMAHPRVVAVPAPRAEGGSSPGADLTTAPLAVVGTGLAMGFGA